MQFEFVIREMVFEDLQSVIEIERDGSLSSWTHAAYLEELERKDSIRLVAERDKRIIGFLIMRLITSSSEAELYNLAAARLNLRKGIGKTLLQKAISLCHLQKIRDIWLEVRKSNENAVKFYRKNGFQIAGERKDFYVQPLENAYLMRLRLSNS